MYWFHYRRAIFFRLFSSLICSIVAINGKINRQELYLIENDCKRKRNLYRCSWKWLEVVCGKMVQEKSVFMWHYVGWLVPIHWLIRMDGKVYGNFPAHELQDVLLCVSVWILISLNRLLTAIKNKVTLLFGCVCVCRFYHEAHLTARANIDYCWCCSQATRLRCGVLYIWKYTESN